MNLSKILDDMSMENKGLRYTLTIAFAFFFLTPLLGFTHFVLKYQMLHDDYLPLFALGVLGSAFFGFYMIRKVFDDLRTTARDMEEMISRDIKGLEPTGGANELEGIVRSFQAVEQELRASFRNLDRRVAQISTLKELSDLCYVTFDTEDLFYITLERALKLTGADIGSVMILEQPKRENFIMQAAIGHSEMLRKGERIPFTDTLARFAVINKSPLLVEDIEQDIRFGRPNSMHYGTKSFLCMPLKGIKEVIGVLNLSRHSSSLPFTQDDVEVLSPLLSGASFTYDNLGLLKKNEAKDQHLRVWDNMNSILSSSLRAQEMLNAILKQIQVDIPFDIALILLESENSPCHMSLWAVQAEMPTVLSPGADYECDGTSIDRVLKQGASQLINDPEKFVHPTEQQLFTAHNLRSCLLFPLKANGATKGVLALAAMQPHALDGAQERGERLADMVALAVEKERLWSSAMKRDQEMAMIKQIGSLLAASTFDMEAVLGHTMDLIRATMEVEAGSLFLVEKDELAFNTGFCADKRVDMELLRSIRLKLGKGIAGYCAARGEPMMVRETAESKEFAPEYDGRTGFVTRSVLCVPLIYLGRVIGVIEVMNKKGGEFSGNDLRLLHSIATSVSIAMENARLYQETLSMAEQERGIRSMFQKFVPKEVVDKITHDSGDAKPVINELKTLTLMNIDIRGFSHLSRKLGPQKTVAMLNYFFGVMGGIVFDHGGIVDKYLGDGFLALFGAPVSDVDDAEHAVAAAWEMKAAVASINAHFAAELDAPIAIGISIHTGEGVVGNIGFERKMDYTVIGDSVNVAFRLQDLCHRIPNGVLISEKTLHALSASRLSLREMTDFDHAQITGGMKIFELLGWQG